MWYAYQSIAIHKMKTMTCPFWAHLVYSHNMAINEIAGIEKSDVKYFNKTWRNVKKYIFQGKILKHKM